MKEETRNPIPVCEVCNELTKRVKTTGGKGRYQCINSNCDNRKYYIRGSKKKEKEIGKISEKEHEELVKRVDLSHTKDFDGSRRIYADQVSTSQAVRRRVIQRLAETNGKADNSK